MATTDENPLHRLWPHRWKLVGCALAGTVLATVYAFTAPMWFESQLVVLPGTSPPSGALAAAGVLAAQLPVDLDLGSGHSDCERIQAVLKSRSVTDAVIAKFDLMHRYHDRYIETTRQTLWQHCSVKIEKKPSTVTLTCEDKDPKVALAIVSHFREVGNQVFRRVAAASATEERKFLEQRVGEAKAELGESSKRLRDFEEKNQVIDIGEQAKAVVSELASLQGELLSKQLELSYVHGFSASDESTTTQLRRQVTLMADQIRGLEQSKTDDATTPKRATPQRPGGSTLFPAAQDVPKMRAELARLYRDQKINETVYLLLDQRYEMAKVNEARDTSAFQVLDDPVEATHKSRPKRSLIILLGFFLGGLAGAAALLARPRQARLPSDSGAPAA